ncbi:Phospholipid phosphatase 3 [Halotydeus destructor]|nr:Phospholipid phosphatase 3 [Halotydeus destructor]
METCRPEPYFNQTVCPQYEEYITDYTCSAVLVGFDVKDIHLSFVSGHSSLMAYAMVHLVLVWQKRFSEDCHSMLRVTLQVLAVSFGLWTALTRLMNNKHHAEDVLGGLLLGSLIAFFIDRAFGYLQLELKSQTSEPVAIQRDSVRLSDM